MFFLDGLHALSEKESFGTHSCCLLNTQYFTEQTVFKTFGIIYTNYSIILSGANILLLHLKTALS
jgi:hypothetical protein